MIKKITYILPFAAALMISPVALANTMAPDTLIDETLNELSQSSIVTVNDAPLSAEAEIASVITDDSNLSSVIALNESDLVIEAEDFLKAIAAEKPELTEDSKYIALAVIGEDNAQDELYYLSDSSKSIENARATIGETSDDAGRAISEKNEVTLAANQASIEKESDNALAMNLVSIFLITVSLFVTAACSYIIAIMFYPDLVRSSSDSSSGTAYERKRDKKYGAKKSKSSKKEFKKYSATFPKEFAENSKLLIKILASKKYDNTIKKYIVELQNNLKILSSTMVERNLSKHNKEMILIEVEHRLKNLQDILANDSYISLIKNKKYFDRSEEAMNKVKYVFEKINRDVVNQVKTINTQAYEKIEPNIELILSEAITPEDMLKPKTDTNVSSSDALQSLPNVIKKKTVEPEDKSEIIIEKPRVIINQPLDLQNKYSKKNMNKLIMELDSISSKPLVANTRLEIVIGNLIVNYDEVTYTMDKLDLDVHEQTLINSNYGSIFESLIELMAEDNYMRLMKTPLSWDEPGRLARETFNIFKAVENNLLVSNKILNDLTEDTSMKAIGSIIDNTELIDPIENLLNDFSKGDDFEIVL